MRRASRLSLKELGAAAFLGFAVGCAVVAITDRSVAHGMQAGTITVDRTHKGDRLTLVPPPAAHSSGLAPSNAAPTNRAPLGCDSAFSPVAEPASARVYLRCLS